MLIGMVCMSIGNRGERSEQFFACSVRKANAIITTANSDTHSSPTLANQRYVLPAEGKNIGGSLLDQIKVVMFHPVLQEGGIAIMVYPGSSS